MSAIKALRSDSNASLSPPDRRQARGPDGKSPGQDEASWWAQAEEKARRAEEVWRAEQELQRAEAARAGAREELKVPSPERLRQDECRPRQEDRLHQDDGRARQEEQRRIAHAEWDRLTLERDSAAAPASSQAHPRDEMRRSRSVRCRFLFACNLGDPVTCVYVNDVGCMAGTVQGKVWLFHFGRKRIDLLTAFSDEGIRGLYLDEDSAYSTLMEGCRGCACVAPHVPLPAVNFRTLDRKSTQTVKYVLQRGPQVCVLCPAASSIVDVSKREHHHRAFKLFDFGASADIAPCDFDGERLAFIDLTNVDGPPIFRVVHLGRNEPIELNIPVAGEASGSEIFGCLSCGIIDTKSDLRASNISLAKLWGSDCLAYVVGIALHIYDYQAGHIRCSLLGHTAEILAVDAQDEETIATLSSDAVVKLWDGMTGNCLQTLHVPEASYFLGYPYCLFLHGRRIVVSADEGVYLVELDAGMS